MRRRTQALLSPAEPPAADSRVRFVAESPWYELFSRGARDWLRHNQKVRQAVRAQIVDLLADSDLITQSSERTVRVPVKMLEHARFKLADAQKQTGAGQGAARTGDTLRPLGVDQGESGAQGQGGNEEGGFKLQLEFQVDDLIDWLAEDLSLPDLRPKAGATVRDEEIVREGTGKRGIRARLDRRWTLKQALKRRAIQRDPAPFTDDDLRFHQLRVRPRLSSNAVVFFALDVSMSMTEAERKLAKTFFFFALSGLRRQYNRIDVRFIAHTTEAWEFPEQQFFEVTGSGGTAASSAFRLALQLMKEHYAPSQYNAYLFYASDGENAADDRVPASETLAALAEQMNYIGYLESRPGTTRFTQTNMRSIVGELIDSGAQVGSQVVADVGDVWQAIRHFFVHETRQSEEARSIA
ncbi:MAG TPA: DUF444 family protein [Casimicrobiaceae bacterium]|jgi:uncharacterized sporulation protein YeaH/YhbH (DUF444 family)|nr:DUF444 family protein [Casimicrobiaceae bacterium]